MEKTLSITISNQFFNIEEDAYEALAKYLEDIRAHYGSEEREEILSDIESSIAEKFLEKVSDKKKFINQGDVEAVIAVLGRVDEIDGDSKEKNAEANPNNPEANSEAPEENYRQKRLYRDEEDVIVAGVCSGIAAYFSIDAVIVRIIFFLLIFANGIGIVAYIVLWIVMPPAKTPAQRLLMRGQPVNLKKIEEKIKEKSTKIREELKKKDPGFLKNLVAFPFKIIEAVVTFIKNIVRSLGPIIAFLIGLSVIALAICGIIGISFASGVFLFHADSPLINTNMPLQEFAKTPEYIVTAVAFYLTGLIPLIFLLLFGISCIRRKNSFKLASSLFFLVVWIAATVVFGLGLFDLVPRIQEKYESERILENNELNLLPISELPDLPIDIQMPPLPSTSMPEILTD